MNKLIVLLVCFLLVTGCAVQESPISTSAEPTLTPQAIASMTPTATLSPTATSFPTPTATLSYPLTNGTPLPPGTTPITAENVASLRQLLLWSQNPSGQQLFSPDGSLLLYATSEWLRIYDVESKTLVTELSEFVTPNGALAISADNQRIMLLQNTTAKVVDFTGKELLSVAAAGQAALSPDGKLLAVLDYCKNIYEILPDCQVSVYDIDSGEILTSYQGDHPQFTPDSSMLIITQQNFIYFRRLSDGVLFRQFDPDNYLSNLSSWSLSPDGSVFISVHDRATKVMVNDQGKEYYESLPFTIDLVSINDGILLAEFIEFAESVFISANNQYCAIVDYDNVQIFDITTKESIYEGAAPDGHYASDIQGVNNDGTLKYAIPVSEIIGFDEPITFTQNLEWKEDAFHFDTFSAYNNQGQYCQTLQTGKAECSTWTSAFLASDGNYYDVQVDAEFITLLKVEGETAEMVTQMDWENQAFNNVSGGSILGYSPANNILVLQIQIGGNVNRVVTVDLNKNLITSNWNWDEVRAQFKVMSPSENFMALKITGRNYGEPKYRWDEGVFDLTKGWFAWRGGSESTYLMRFSQDEKYLLEVQYREPLQYGNPRTSYVFIYDFIEVDQLAYYEMQREFSGEYNEACYVNDAEFSPDNSMLFFACEDGTLLVTEPLTGEKIARWQAFNEPVTEISISADGTRLTAGASGLIKMWDVP